MIELLISSSVQLSLMERNLLFYQRNLTFNKNSADLGRDINGLLEQARTLKNQGVTFTTQKVFSDCNLRVLIMRKLRLRFMIYLIKQILMNYVSIA